MKNLFVLFLLSCIMISCGKTEENGLTVEEYITANNLTTRELDKGVHIIVHSLGNDNNPHSNSRIKAAYSGKLTTGEVFDSGDEFETNFLDVIEGWQIGLKELGENGSCTLILPPEVAYGSNEVPGIPANSTLVFEITLLRVF